MKITIESDIKIASLSITLFNPDTDQSSAIKAATDQVKHITEAMKASQEANTDENS